MLGRLDKGERDGMGWEGGGKGREGGNVWKL